MARVALINFLVGLGAIIFELANLSVIESSNPWLKALPALVPFIALIATVFFAVAKDVWMMELAKAVISTNYCDKEHLGLILRCSRRTTAAASVHVRASDRSKTVIIVPRENRYGTRQHK